MNNCLELEMQLLQPWSNEGPIQQIYQIAYQQALMRRTLFKNLLAKIVGTDEFEIKTDIKHHNS